MSSYVVVDLEMCKVPFGAARSAFKSSSELIQIGAVLVDDNYCIMDTFMTYVSPQFGAIDSFVQRLTGITKKHTQGAPSARDALDAFASWIPDDACIVSWSDNDRIQIKREIAGKEIDIPRLNECMEEERWIDCQALFADKMNAEKNYRLSEALVIAEIDYNEGAHDALVDARNTALLFRKIRNEDTFTVSPYLICSDMINSYSFNPFAKACRVGAY